MITYGPWAVQATLDIYSKDGKKVAMVPYPVGNPGPAIEAEGNARAIAVLPEVIDVLRMVYREELRLVEEHRRGYLPAVKLALIKAGAIIER